MIKTKSRIKINRLLRLVKHTSLGKEGYIKVSSNTSYEHTKKCLEVAYMLKKHHFLIYSEVEFKTGGRADLVGFSPEGEGYILEILIHESEKRFNEKLSKYPLEFEIIKITQDTDLSKMGLFI